MKTEHHEIGGNVPYLIAEIGLNHNGEEALAIRMIEEAARSGAHCVKFQLYSAERFFDTAARFGSGEPGSLAAFFRQFELKSETWSKLVRAASSCGVDFLCSVFDDESLLFYRDLLSHKQIPDHFLKVASTDLTHRLLLEKARDMNFRILLSTGASDEAEVQRAIAWIGTPSVLFQCVSSYPAQPVDYNLSLIPFWQKKYGCMVGVSDHCEGLTVSYAASVLGAASIERHFTVDRKLPGPDQELSSTPEQFRQLRDDLEILAATMGDGIKRSMPSEDGVRQHGRRSIHYSRDIEKGTILSGDDLTALRPGGGIGAESISELAGRRLNRSVRGGDRTLPGDFT